MFCCWVWFLESGGNWFLSLNEFYLSFSQLAPASGGRLLYCTDVLAGHVCMYGSYRSESTFVEIERLVEGHRNCAIALQVLQLPLPSEECFRVRSGLDRLTVSGSFVTGCSPNLGVPSHSPCRPLPHLPFWWEKFALNLEDEELVHWNVPHRPKKMDWRWVKMHVVEPTIFKRHIYVCMYTSPWMKSYIYKQLLPKMQKKLINFTSVGQY